MAALFREAYSRMRRAAGKQRAHVISIISRRDTSCQAYAMSAHQVNRAAKAGYRNATNISLKSLSYDVTMHFWQSSLRGRMAESNFC